MDAIILCGGLGTRIRTVTQDSYPKTMIPIAGKTILEWEMSWLRKYDVKHAILAVRHLADYIEEQFGNTYSTDYGTIEVSYSKEKEKLGSGGAVRQANEFVGSKETIIVNGDIMTNFDLGEMNSYHAKVGAMGTIATSKMRSPFGIVDTDGDNTILQFREKPILDHWIHAGVDTFKSELLKDFPEKGQMEETIFVSLAEEKRLKAFKIDPKYFWRSIDNPKDLQDASKEWKGLD
ncbi:MAG: nucleotidyltransferase family protein [Candidatus Heimdallarchaeaceae archaeon]